MVTAKSLIYAKLTDLDVELEPVHIAQSLF
jgi:hypothetical protein